MKILLLEDSQVDAEIIQRLLLKEINDCRLKLAMDKKTFLAALDEFVPDVILSDNSLPGFNATEALRIVRQRLSHAPFILLTGTVSEEYAASIIKEGADDYVLKDRMARLPAAIEAAVKLRQNEVQKHEALVSLQQSEEKYRTIMERVSDAFVAMDKDGQYTYVNKSAGEILQRSSESLIGKSIWNEFPYIVGMPFHEAFLNAMETQHYIRIEQYYEPFGRWVENHIHPSPEGVSVFFRDITEQKIAAKKIIESEENLKAIFDNSSEAFVLLDEKGIIKIFNERAVHIVLDHYKGDITVGTDIYQYIDPARKDFIARAFSQVIKGQVIQYDRPFQQEDGSIIWVNFSFNPVCKGNEVTGVCITGRDVTEKKLAEQQLEFNHNNLSALINNTTDLMWSVDLSFKIITSNEAFNTSVKNVSGVHQVKGLEILMVAPDEEQSKRYKKYYERAFSGEAFTEIEFDSKPVETWRELSFYPIYEKGQVIGTACFARDITERIKSDTKLRELEHEKLESKIREQKRITRVMLNTQEKERNAIGTELHDNVNQILVGTKMLLSMVQDDPMKNAHIIQKCINQLRNAIDENRKIAHVFVAPELETETLVALLKTLTSNMLGTSGIEIDFKTDGFCEEVIDQDRKINIYRIAQEHCTNIVKYARASKVKIILGTDEHLFHMSISDDGVGVVIDKKTKGIGLRNIKNRLDLFEGKMAITSAPSKGFQLDISIPLLNNPDDNILP